MSNSRPGGGGDDRRKRNLPSWMSSRDDGSKSKEKKATTASKNEQSEQLKDGDAEPSNKAAKFSRLLEGVVFVLSGFVNPERATLRSQALEMGAEYRPDWSSDCTLLVCAYSNTPKFRQVEADSGTVVKKEWITECYNQRKLVEIDSYLMHAGRPWRKGSVSNENEKEKESFLTKPDKQVERKLPKPSKPIAGSSTKRRPSHSSKEHFSPSKIKKWAIDDLGRTIAWLESQDEKPDPSDIKQIAAKGIMICLQDAVDLLEQNQDVRKISEQWNVVPHAIEELVKLADAGNGSASFSKEDLCRQAKSCKQMYEAELSTLHDDSPTSMKRMKTDGSKQRCQEKSKAISDEYDSDETIEMTEEEIDLACNAVRSTICK